MTTPTPDPQQVVCECGHPAKEHNHFAGCTHRLDMNALCDCCNTTYEVVLESDITNLESELTRLKSACAKEHESVQKLDEENQRLRAIVEEWNVLHPNVVRHAKYGWMSKGAFEEMERWKPLTDFLEQNYYVEQRKVMDIYLDHLWRVKINQVEHISGLEEKLRDMASNYVHGANLTAVISSNRQLRAVLEEVRTHLDAIRGAFGELVAICREGTPDRAYYEHELKAAWEYAKLIQDALNQTTESAK